MKLVAGCACNQCGDEFEYWCEGEPVTGGGYNVPRIYCDCGAEVIPHVIIEDE